MNLNVIYEGDADMIDFPFIINNDDWIIPRGWYLLDNIIYDLNPIVLFQENEKPIIVIENIQINHSVENKEYKLSVIKTDKKIKVGDKLTVK